MELKILWLYPEDMNLYGDRGNIEILRKRCQWRNIDVRIDGLRSNDQCTITDYDLIYMGGGPDSEQMQIYADCLARTEAFHDAYIQGSVFLLICGGYQLFGQYYMDQDNHRIDGVGLFHHYTESGHGKRCVGNLLVETELDHQKVQLVGFENHGGQTYGVEKPLGIVRYGQGNAFGAEAEGLFDRTVVGTYMHGPLLAKNPELADYLIRQALARRYGDVTLATLDDSLAQKARKIMVDRLLAKQ